MPYQQNIPLATDQLDDSQGDIQGNFQEIYNWIAINHEQFGAAAGQGKHKQVTLPENTVPTPTLIDEANIFSRFSVLTQTTELAWQRENNGPVIEWTGSATEGAPISTAGWTRLPSGLLVKWGTGSSTGTGYVYTYPVDPQVPAFVNLPLVLNSPFFVLATTVTNGGIVVSVVPNSVVYNQFIVNTYDVILGAPAPSDFYFVAVGY